MTISPIVPVVPSAIQGSTEASNHDPAWVVQCAWSVFRLPRLQEFIQLTINQLHSLRPNDLLGHEVKTLEQSHCDPVAEALRACCEELRDASGMVGAQATRASHCRMVRNYIETEPAAWSETFAEALGKYRVAAARGLETMFARAVS
jgi:hypothetical protein